VNVSDRLRLIAEEASATKSLTDNKKAASKITSACKALIAAAELIGKQYIDAAQIPMWPDETKTEEPDF